MNIRRRWTTAVVWAWALAATIASAAVQKPDILFIAIDDLNDWTGCLGGHPQARTPHLDHLAARGVLFANAQCAAPACNPSRAALMSGLRPYTTGIYLNSQPYGPVLKDTLTLNRYMRECGYYVAGGGKIYHGSGGLPEQKGDWWDEYFKRPGDPSPPRKSMTGLNRDHFDWGPLDAADEDMGDHALVTWAAGKLNEKGDKPLFLAVGFVKPHLPWYVPRKYFDMFPIESVQLPTVRTNDLDDVPPAGVKMANPSGDHAAVTKAGLWKSGVQAYLATIAFLDGQIGRLIEAADASWRSNRLQIVLWSDHGWHLGEKDHWRKFTLWEESARAPLLFVAPGITRSGGRCEAPVDFVSVYPTVCDMAGLVIPPHVQGRSLMPLLKDPSAVWDGVGITTHGRGNHAVRDGRWRYIRYEDGGEELYDHQSDPNEWTNLARRAGHEETVRRLASRLPTTEAPDAPREAEGADRPRRQREAAAARPAASGRGERRNQQQETSP